MVESEDSFHNLAYRLYEARDEEEIVRVMVAQHLKQDFSYVIYVVTPTPLMDAYDTTFFFWFSNIYGLEKVKKVPASTAQDSDAEAAASFYGNYEFDVESSMARCERLNSHDCKDWGSGTHAEVKRAEYRNNFGKLKNMTLSIGPSAFEMGGRKAKYSVELATWELFAISVEDEPLVLLREQSNVICMSATNPNSDVMCFSK